MSKQPIGGPKLRLLWHSVAPWIASGYGKATREICTRLPKYGYEVIISAYYGTEPGGVPPYSVPVLPSKEGQYGVVSAARYCKQFNVDLGVLFTDWWAFSDFPKIIPRATVYGPMDQIGYSEELTRFTQSFYKVIGLCKWQQKCLKEKGIESEYIYHGVDTNCFRPNNKKDAKKKIGLNSDDLFVFGTIAANGDKEDRKAHARSMKAMSYFLEQNPDVKNIVWLYHTSPNDPRGMPLLSISHKFGLDGIIRFMDPGMTNIMLSEQDLATLMNCFDVHLLCSKREGFGMPILETEACGVPNICHDFSSMTELVQGHGWLCESLGQGLNLETTPINGETAVPDVYDIAECIKDAYFHPDKVEKYGEESRKFALPYDWDNLVENQWVPLLDTIASDIRPSKDQLFDKRFSEAIA